MNWWWRRVKHLDYKKILDSSDDPGIKIDFS